MQIWYKFGYNHYFSKKKRVHLHSAVYYLHSPLDARRRVERLVVDTREEPGREDFVIRLPKLN